MTDQDNRYDEKHGSPGNCIVKWDGQRWHRLGNGLTQDGYEATVQEMVVYHDNLYVLGSFNKAGSIKANRIAKWDGQRWCSLNTTFGGTARAMQVSKGELYVGGGFWSINGDTTLSKMVRWTGGDYTQECGPIEATEIAESPGLPSNTLLYPNAVGDKLFVKPGNVRQLFIYDALGKLFKTFNRIDLMSGINASVWPAGFYFARAITPAEEVMTSTFIKE